MLGSISLQGMETGQKIFRDDIKTLKVYNPDKFMAPPVINLNSSDRLNINFDIMGDSHEYLRYRLIHCNADWQPSALLESEYIDGFNEINIEDFAYSKNTYTHYVNYNISIPDPEYPILKSGNYLLQVFPENNPEDLILQTRFSVSENSNIIKGSVSSTTDKGKDTEYQQLTFSIDLSAFEKINPYQDIFVVISQNNYPQTKRIIRVPTGIRSSNAIYEHNPDLIYEAGNEYRRFETVRTDYPGMHVDSVKFINGQWNAWLKTDFPRINNEYSYDSTQHGRFKIDEYNSSEPDLSADYVNVHFTLDPIERINGNIYIIGEFSNYTIQEQNRLLYDWKDGLFHAEIPLKQGSYNYEYIVLPDNSNNPSSRPIEGNKYETRNEYLIEAYLRTPGSRADRLIGNTVITVP